MACCRKFRRLLMTPLVRLQKEWRVANRRSRAAENEPHVLPASDLKVSLGSSARCGGWWFEAKRRKSLVAEACQNTTIGVQVRVDALPQALSLPVGSGSAVRQFRFDPSTARAGQCRVGAGRARCFGKGAKERGLTGLLPSSRNAARPSIVACHFAHDDFRPRSRHDRDARHSPGHSATGRLMLHNRMRAGGLPASSPVPPSISFLDATPGEGQQPLSPSAEVRPLHSLDEPDRL
jgi:hypothetical protein